MAPMAPMALIELTPKISKFDGHGRWDGRMFSPGCGAQAR
jgi:hypothetical protein